jgi:hypothetical protein
VAPRRCVCNGTTMPPLILIFCDHFAEASEAVCVRVCGRGRASGWADCPALSN